MRSNSGPEILARYSHAHFGAREQARAGRSDSRSGRVALRLSVNDWTLHNWENNETTPAIRYMPRIIAFLGYDPWPAPRSVAERL